VGGGIAGLAILVVLVFILLRRRPVSPLPMAQQTQGSTIYSSHPSSMAPVSPLILPVSTPGSPQLYPIIYTNQVPTNYTNSATTMGRPLQYVGTPEL
jgi:hypothetical protein